MDDLIRRTRQVPETQRDSPLNKKFGYNMLLLMAIIYVVGSCFSSHRSREHQQLVSFIRFNSYVFFLEISYWKTRLDNAAFVTRTFGTEKNQSPIQEFYSGTIFITGVTGFLGLVLLEKLLRSCPNIKKIYILLRSKHNKTIACRLNEILKSQVSR